MKDSRGGTQKLNDITDENEDWSAESSPESQEFAVRSMEHIINDLYEEIAELLKSVNSKLTETENTGSVQDMLKSSLKFIGKLTEETELVNVKHKWLKQECDKMSGENKHLKSELAKLKKEEYFNVRHVQDTDDQEEIVDIQEDVDGEGSNSDGQPILFLDTCSENGSDRSVSSEEDEQYSESDDSSQDSDLLDGFRIGDRVASLISYKNTEELKVPLCEGDLGTIMGLGDGDEPGKLLVNFDKCAGGIRFNMYPDSLEWQEPLRFKKGDKVISLVERDNPGRLYEDDWGVVCDSDTDDSAFFVEFSSRRFALKGIDIRHVQVFDEEQYFGFKKGDKVESLIEFPHAKDPLNEGDAGEVCGPANNGDKEALLVVFETGSTLNIKFWEIDHAE